MSQRIVNLALRLFVLAFVLLAESGSGTFHITRYTEGDVFQNTNSSQSCDSGASCVFDGENSSFCGENCCYCLCKSQTPTYLQRYGNCSSADQLMSILKAQSTIQGCDHRIVVGESHRQCQKEVLTTLNTASPGNNSLYLCPWNQKVSQALMHFRLAKDLLRCEILPEESLYLFNGSWTIFPRDEPALSKLNVEIRPDPAFNIVDKLFLKWTADIGRKYDGHIFSLKLRCHRKQGKELNSCVHFKKSGSPPTTEPVTIQIRADNQVSSTRLTTIHNVTIASAIHSTISSSKQSSERPSGDESTSALLPKGIWGLIGVLCFLVSVAFVVIFFLRMKQKKGRNVQRDENEMAHSQEGIPIPDITTDTTTQLRNQEISTRQLGGRTSSQVEDEEEGIPMLDIMTKTTTQLRNQQISTGQLDGKTSSQIEDEEEGIPMLDIMTDTTTQARNQEISTRQLDRKTSSQVEDEVVDNETYLKEMGIDRNWEIPRERLKITEDKLGEGEFGVVKKGIYLRRDGMELPVAVKMLKDNTDQSQRLALIQELETLRNVGRHSNIVSLVGVCSFEEPLCVIVEFVSGGSLHKILCDSRISAGTGTEDSTYVNNWSKLSERELLQIASDVSNGMRHLESKLCVHRDLAARNILVGKGLVAKVADFGMARDVSEDGEYIKCTEGKVPWLWMSIESLRGISTTMSDVWSFGVVLWEIVTLGERPYRRITGIVELHTMLLDGVRLEKPPHCSEELYEIMLQCWQEAPGDRPTFKDLHTKLHKILYEKAITYINVQYVEEQETVSAEESL